MSAQRVQIKDYAGKTVAQARADCEALQLKLAIVTEAGSGSTVPINEVTTRIQKNAPDSAPRDWREPGSVVGVVIYPFEPRQRR